LGIPLTGKAQVPKNLERVERTKKYGEWRNWFTPEDVARFQPVLTPYLKRYGYDFDDWRLSDAPIIRSEHCSRYFTSLVQERRERTKQRESQEAKKRAAAEARKNETAEARAARRSERARRARKGRLARVEPSAVVGWAMGADALTPATVQLFVNGELVKETVANVMRPGLRDRGDHPTGLCGFAFRFAPDKRLAQGDEVRVKIAADQSELSNSPYVVGHGTHQKSTQAPPRASRE
jgi:hypothetical protein